LLLLYAGRAEPSDHFETELYPEEAIWEKAQNWWRDNKLSVKTSVMRFQNVNVPSV